MLDLHFRLPRNKIYRVGPFSFTMDDLNDAEAGRLAFVTDWNAELRDPQGNIKQIIQGGPGLLTFDAVNQLIGQIVTGTSVVPAWASTKYLSYGIAGSPAYTDADTNCTTEGTQARSLLTLTQSQTASGANHAGILQYKANAVAITAAAIYTEFAIVDTASGAVTHCLDHKAYSPTAVAAVADTLTTTYTLQINSNV
jgi:hypothetical protein